MSNSNEMQLKQICEMLNKMIEIQPDIVRVFDSGIEADPGLHSIPMLRIRPTVEGDWVTMCGVISAIGRMIGEAEGLEISSTWDIGTDEEPCHKLTGFAVTKVMPKAEK